MEMPAARGLFHRAIAQNPTTLLTRTWTTEQSRRTTVAMLAHLGVGRDNLDRFQTMPFDALAQGFIAVARQDRTHDMRPAVDGVVLSAHPFEPTAPGESADVPLLVGTVTRESGPLRIFPRHAAESLTEDQLRTRVETLHPGRADSVIAAFRALHPEMNPRGLLERIGDVAPRNAAIAQAQRKAVQKAAPAYLYHFDWRTPAFEGRPGAFHGAEIPFVFNNVDRCSIMTGGGPEAHALSARMCDAWVRFARTGNPNHAGLPEWRPCSADSAPTMIFDDVCALKVDHDAAARRSVARIAG